MKRKSVIRELFYNNPCVIEAIPMGDEYSHRLSVADKLETELKCKFKDDKETLDLLGRFIEADGELAAEEAFCFFKEGLRFGILLGLEITEE